MGERMSSLSPGELSALPVFPLPSAVLFPSTTMPLHLFEPRYVAMIEECLSKGPSAIAVALFKLGWESDYEGRPPIYDAAGAGRIVTHERRPNGSYDIVLQGVARVRLSELPADGRLFRRAFCSPLEDVVLAGRVDLANVSALLGCASTLAGIVRKNHPTFSLDISADDPPGRLADRIADRLIVDVPTRQSILEELDINARVRATTDALTDVLALVSTKRSTA